MTEHSPEAVAAFPSVFDNDPHISIPAIILVKRSAFDRGMESGYQQGLLAAKPAAPNPDTREALATLIQEGFPTGGGGYSVIWEDCLPIADAILASGIIRDEREVKAEALEEFAEARPVGLNEHDPVCWTCDVAPRARACAAKLHKSQ